LTDPFEFLARVLIHVPEPNKLHFYGAYANRVRANYRCLPRPADTDHTPSPRRALNQRWAELIYRIYEVDPLTCTQCGAEMKILAFITEHATIKKILHHRDKNTTEPRAPPPKTLD